MKCPSCGYEMEGRQCEHCGAAISPRFTMRRMFMWMAVLAVIGVSCSIAAAFWNEGAVRVKDITPELNGRHIEITGTVVDVSYYPEKYGEFGSISLTVYDGTGLIKASLTADVMEDMVVRGDIPHIGQRITVGGTYYGGGVVEDRLDGVAVPRADGTLKVINSQYVTVHSTEPDQVSPEELRSSGLGDYGTGDVVRVAGRVEEAGNRSYGFVIGLQAGDMILKVIVPDYVVELTGAPDVSADMFVNLTGGLVWYEYYYKGSYYGYWEVITVPDSIEVTGAADYREYSIYELADNLDKHEGELVVLKNLTVREAYWKTAKTGEVYAKSIVVGTWNASIYVYIEPWEQRITNLTNETRIDIYGRIEKYESGTYEKWEIKIKEGTGDRVVLREVSGR